MGDKQTDAVPKKKKEKKTWNFKVCRVLSRSQAQQLFEDPM
jgi:hypothetical protein